MARRTLTGPLILAALLAAPAAPAADLRGGIEFRLNSYTTGAQDDPSVAAQGPVALVAWESAGQDGSGDAIVVRAAGRRDGPLGPEFLVNTYTTGAQDDPVLVALEGGGFAVAWESTGQDGSGEGVFARLLSPEGEPMGAEFAVTTRTTSNQDAPAAAALPGGGFVVVWEDLGGDGSGEGLAAQLFDAEGGRLGAELRINEDVADDQYEPSVAGHAGGFVLAWASASPAADGSGAGILARRFDAQGAPLGAEVRVNTYTTGEQTHPTVAAAPDGAFVVAWASYGQDGSGYAIAAQRFDAEGLRQGEEFVANTYTPGSQGWPAVALQSGGAFLVVWESAGQDGSGDAVVGRAYGPDGSSQGGERRLNGASSGAQEDAAVAASGPGGFLVVWESADGGSDGVFGRRVFRAPRP